MGLNRDLKKTLISGGRSLVQSQVPYAPFVTSLPATNDPQSQDGSLVVLLAGGVDDGLYGFDARTQPGQWKIISNIASGTVTSFSAAPTSIFDVATPTTTPALSLDNQAANLFLAGPSSGAATTPTFRALTTPDLPIIVAKNITLVSVNTSTTSDQDLMTFSVPANTLNTIGKVLELICYGTFDEDATSGAVTITFKVKLGSITILSWVPNTPNTTKTSLPWRIYGHIITASTGATGTLEAHGEFSSDPATASGTVGQPMLDHNTAVSSGIDLTSILTLKITIAFSTSLTTNVGRQRLMLVKVLN